MHVRALTTTYTQIHIIYKILSHKSDSTRTKLSSTDTKSKVEMAQQRAYALSLLLYLSKSRFPLWSKESKALFPGPPRPLLLRPPLGPPRPLSGLSRSNLSTGLEDRNDDKW